MTIAVKEWRPNKLGNLDGIRNKWVVCVHGGREGRSAYINERWTKLGGKKKRCGTKQQLMQEWLNG